MTYFDVALYCLLLLLALFNIWVVVPHKYQMYKMLPIPAFYTFAVLALALRPFYIIGGWTFDPVYGNLDFVQQGAKLCVGIVQDWITLELAIRIHTERGE